MRVSTRRTSASIMRSLPPVKAFGMWFSMSAILCGFTKNIVSKLKYVRVYSGMESERRTTVANVSGVVFKVVRTRTGLRLREK